MYLICLMAALVLLIFLVQRPRRRPGDPFDWSYRRRWWRLDRLFWNDR
jgi:hypothetical protein